MTSPSSVPDAAAAAADLHALFARLCACGATPAGGVTRLCASPEDGAARAVLAGFLREAGAAIRTDAVGNQFGIFSLAGAAGAPLVMLGSHLDSQPRAGRFDGTYGVAAAAAVGADLMRARRAGAAFDADLCVVNWTNEEGARFRPSLLGSGVYAGHHAAAAALECRDDAGTSLGEALSAIGALGTDAPPPLPACYLELHVEQGTRLEEAGATIGVVARNWGAAKIEVVFTGEQAHTGPTRMGRRRDALVAAAALITAVRALADDWPDRVHTSVGRLLVAPNSANVVPAEAVLSVEIRSGEDDLLAAATARAEAAIAAAAAGAGVAVDVRSRSLRPIRPLPGAVCDLAAACAEAEGLPSLRMDTVAGHDAISLLGLCPTGLIFVPSRDGVAHNEAEFTAEADLEAGLRVALRAAARLCRAGGDPVRALHRAGDPSGDPR
ncbi:Zn-dependent hydrolase [Methylobacterium oryzihabitans]|uniref:Zn-dependent hydrolase n=1 Tax=Methylobacterium oryzihabitans TaxID=2499852 RepID=A0A3S2VBZ8_9HYPH|nr:Zn-dependent hydrolase [Methylobacterium oryzihabitans]RVU19439.1 Zn-dependent hydrolase [Methylobacterium oryzihabitans]